MIPLRRAARVWARIALQSFGGPAGQIAVMHRILVDEERWISERRFLHALRFCTLLPGPEATQLAMEADALTPEDRELLGRSLDDIVADTPRTAVAATRVKRILAKVRDEGLVFSFKEIVLPLATETAKKLIWGI